MRRVAVNATPAQGAYLLTGGRFSSGGAVSTATLDAVQCIPRGARLILTFGHPSTALSCGAIRNGVSYLSIARTGSVRPGSYGCSMAHTLGTAWTAAFRAHRSTETVTAAGITVQCKLVPRLPQNFVCDGGNLRVRFPGRPDEPCDRGVSGPSPDLADAGPNCPRCGAPMVAGDDREPTEVWRCPSCGLEMSERS